MPWLILTLAGLFEIIWAVGLKYTVGFTRFWPTVATVLAMLASFWLLAMAARDLPIGTAYAVWTGIGVIGTVIYGIWKFGESAGAMRMASLALIVIGIIGVRLAPAGMDVHATPKDSSASGKSDR
jgi:quaternary ammonium compound-resistance protein SugE